MYAKRTTVSADRSIQEIVSTLKRYGATGYGFGNANNVGMVAFEAQGRRVRFRANLPNQDKHPQEYRTRWRALLLAIKAKLESVASGIETFDEAFMAQIVMPNGQTYGEWSLPQISHAYETKEMPPLLGFDP